MSLKLLIVMLISFIFSNALYAKDNSFDFITVWKSILSNSNMIKATDFELESAELQKQRAARHWLPTVYLDAKTYNTNDPGAAFFGLLEQKSLKATDFDPASLNSPKATSFSRGALGLDLVLYQGGFSTEFATLQSENVRQKEYEKKQKIVSLYSEVVKLYAGVGVLDQQEQKLNKVNTVIEKILKNYQLGSKSNPVGYSGLLGLKSLSLKIKGLVTLYKNQIESFQTALHEIGFTEKKWHAQMENVTSFVNTYSVAKGLSESEAESFNSEAFKIKKQMSEKAIELERARFLPKVGVFAENYIFSGDRDSASGYTAGVYLQWNLFKADDYGLIKEGQLKAKSAERYYLANKEQETAEYKAKKMMVNALRENLELINESESLLNEQTQVAETLFRNGSINVLQFSELLNRKVDLITNQTELIQKYITTQAEALTKVKFNPPMKFDKE
jgi:outer membrane protein TolC